MVGQRRSWKRLRVTALRRSRRLVDDGRGWGPRLKHAAYAQRSDAQIIAGLKSWSPVVRERSAMEALVAELKAKDDGHEAELATITADRASALALIEQLQATQAERDAEMWESLER